MTSSASTNSSSSATEDPGAGTGLPPGAIWVPVQVHNASAIGDEIAGASVFVEFDHLSFVARGARLDGKDVRLYSVRGALATQLHRVLDPESSWNSSNTKLWFRLDGGVGGLETQGDVYYLVFQEQSPEPLSDPDQVFAFYDDFNQPTLDAARWELKTMDDAPGVNQEVQVTNGELSLSAGPSGAGLVSSAGVRSRLPMNLPGVEVEVSLRFEPHSENDDCTLENLAGLWSHGQDQARMIWQRGGNVWEVLNDTTTGSVSRRFLASRPGSGEKRRYLLDWRTSLVEVFSNSQRQGDARLSSTTFLTPAGGTLNLGFDARANGIRCNDRVSRLWVDWVFARPSSPDADLSATFMAAQEETKN